MQPEPHVVLAEALDKLAAEGSPEHIARFLDQHRVKGRIGSPVSCPIATYLDRLVDTNEYTIVGPMGAHVVRDSGRACEPFDLYSVDLPAPVAEFVAQFDDGCFPHLQHDGQPEGSILR